MMRQLGGSFGIAIITTFITRLSQEHRVNLLTNLDPAKYDLQQRLAGMQKVFMSKGYSADVALKKAYQAIDYSVLKQSTVMAYMDIFMYLGIMFLCCIPIIFFIKKGKNKVNPADAMH
jgi:DHA2 family multidrug resistance protein